MRARSSGLQAPTTKRIHAVVPTRPLASAKERLSSVLSAAERIRLVRWMLERVLGVLSTSSLLHRVWVVGGDREIQRLCAQVAVCWLPERGRDLNETLCCALEHAAKHGATHVLIIPADLPFLCPRHIDRLVASLSPGRAVIASAGDGGTNALLLPVPAPFALAYGPRSAAVHTLRARKCGLRVRVIAEADLARDIDTPDDLRLLADHDAWRRDEKVEIRIRHPKLR